MILSDFGEIVETEWYKSFKIRKELILHQFVIMPNHLHTIVEIYNPTNTHVVEAHIRAPLQRRASNSSNDNETINPELSSIKRNHPIRLPKSISSFIAGFKSSVNTKSEREYRFPKTDRRQRF